MYRCEIAVGGSVTFEGPADSWIRIDVLAIDGDQVQIGFAWPEEYRPRGGGRSVRLGRFRVRALKYVGGSRVQLGIDTAPGFRAVRSDQRQQEQTSTRGAPLRATCPEEGAGNLLPARERREDNAQVSGPAAAPAGRRDRRRRQRARTSLAARGGEGTTAEEDAVPASRTPVSSKALARLLSLNAQRFQ